MSKKFAALGALAGVIAASSGASSAQAGALMSPITQSQEFSLRSLVTDPFSSFEEASLSGSNTETETLSFQMFDSSMGTLTGVRAVVSLEGNVFLEGTGLAVEGNPTEGATINANGQGTFNLALAGDANVLGLSGFVMDDCTGEGFGSCQIADDSGIGSPGEFASFDINAFIGMGTIDFDAKLTSSLSGSVNGTLFGAVQVESVAIGEVELQYTFIANPTEVSEPATLALLGLGLAGVAVSRRKTKA